MHKPNLFQTILTEDVMMEKTLREQLSTRGLKWLLVVFAWLLLPLGAWADDDFTLSYGSATGLESVTFAVDGTPATTAKANDVVTVTAKGVEGYAATAITATAGSGGSATQLTVTKVGGKFAQWTFTMPAEAVSITATMENVWGVSEQVDGSTKEKAYVITTTAGLDLLAEKVNSGTIYNYKGKYFKLGADITYKDLTIDNDNDGTNDSNYTPIGGHFGGLKLFCGTFDGGGHTVKGITIVRNGYTEGDWYQGLFGYLGEGGTVSHVTLDESSIKGFSGIGGIVGEKNGGNIIDCHVTASVSIIASQTDSWDLGGIAGYNYSGLIAGCTSAASIKGVNNSTENLGFGGITGANDGTIKDCIYLGSEVGGVKYVGAITGDNFDASVTNCYYTDVNFVGKDISGNDVTLDNGNPAIGVSVGNVTVTNVGLARTITLDGKVPISGTSTPYGLDGAAIALTAYAPKADDPGYALALTTGGESPTTTLYSMAGTNVVLVTGESYAVEVKVTATDGGDDVTSTVYANGTLTVPTYDVKVSAEDLWGIGQGADGSQEHPFIITTTAGLDLLAKKVNSGTNYEGKYFKLGADITYDKNNLTIDNDNDGTNDSNYTPIGGYFGGSYKYFCGTFDGGGHTVKGITIVRKGKTNGDKDLGLFGDLGADGTVSHVTLDESSIKGFFCTGGIVGYNYGGNIIDCHVTASVSIIASQTDSYYLGGIAGINVSGIAGCTSAASIQGAGDGTKNVYFGGIAGANEGTIKDCIYLGSEVGGGKEVGAITGNNSGASVINCYYTDVNFVGKDNSGNNVTLGNGNPAIGVSYGNATVTNVGLARAITLGNNVAIDGTSTPYGLDGAAIALTAYAPKADDPGFALALTTGGESPTTTLYSTAGTNIKIGLQTTLSEGYVEAFTATKTSDGTDVTADVISDATLTTPTYDVTVSAEDLWGIGQGADGSKEHPYVITTTLGLDLLAEKVNSGTVFNYQGKYFKLGADITYKDLTIDNDNDGTNDSNYTPIGGHFGGSYKYFCGTFDGGGHTVKGITIVRKGYTDGDMYQGLFGILGADGTVSHVTLDESSIKGIFCTGGIVGYNYGGNIIDCHVTASVSIIASQTDSWYLGGIAGDNYSGLIAGCTSAASIKGVNNSTDNVVFGGIAGSNSGTIKDCIYLGSEVGGGKYVGAITGYNYDASVTNCYYTDVNFVGKDDGGNDVTLDNGNPAIGVSVGNVTETNVGLARTITLGNNVAIDGTSTPYSPDGAAIALTAYAPKADDPGFALALTTGGESPTTTLYSTAGANIKIGLQTTLSEGYVEAFTATKTSDGTDVTADVISDATLTTPTYDVTVSAEDVWGIEQKADGSQEHPYVITTTAGLDLLAKKVNSGTRYNYQGKYFKLGADITYDKNNLTIDNDNDGTNDSNYTPIGGYFGDDYKLFCGTFDGGGHTVKGITIVRKVYTDGDKYQGLFGILGADGTVSHVTLDQSSITGHDCTGGIVGVNGGNIIDCHVTASVSIIASHSNSWYLGGIAGSNHGTIKDCIYLGSEVGGGKRVGAITGYNYNASVTNCYYIDVNFVGKDNSGNNITLDNGNPAIGVSVGNVTETNVGLARTITLGNNVAIDGTSTPYGLDGAAIALTAYAPKADDPGFALALTTGGESPTTTLYSTAGAKVGIKYDGTLPTGVKPTFTVTKSQSGTVDVSETSGAYNFTMPSDDVTVSVLTGTTVSVAAQSWATYYGSQAVSLTDGQQDCALYTLSEVDTESVTLSAVSGVASKETPLLIWNGSDTARDILLSFTAEPASPTAHAPQFTGTVDGIQVGSITNGSVYVLYNNEFVKASGGRIGENRAFIVMPTGNAARQLIIGDATRIGTTDYPNEAGTWYSLDGRKLAGKPTRPGAYIVDGKKKVLIK